MVSVVGEGRPLSGKLFSFFAEEFSVFLLHGALHKVRVARERHDCLDRAVRVMSKVSGKIVRAELVFWIEPLFDEIMRPLLEKIPILSRIFDRIFGASDDVEQDEHVRTFFDGHLSFFGLFSAAVHLAFHEGIASEIMRRVGPWPSFARVLHNRRHRAFEQLNIIDDKERRAGV